MSGYVIFVRIDQYLYSLIYYSHEKELSFPLEKYLHS
jgi:hypothetical protein